METQKVTFTWPQKKRRKLFCVSTIGLPDSWLLHYLDSIAATVGEGRYHDGHAVGLSHLLACHVEVADTGNSLVAVQFGDSGTRGDDEFDAGGFRPIIAWCLSDGF